MLESGEWCTSVLCEGVTEKMHGIFTMRLKICLSHIYHSPAPITPQQLIYTTLLSLHRRLGDKTLGTAGQSPK
jgi:hypothetical protein